MKFFETEVWGQSVEVEYEIDGEHRAEAAHDHGWDPPESPEIHLHAVLVSHPVNLVSVDLLPVLDDSERETIMLEIEASLE